MARRDVCIFNRFIQCTDQVKCARCNWNPTYFEHKKEERRNERQQKAGARKNGKKNTTML